MNIGQIKRAGISPLGISGVGSSGSKSTGSFQQSMENQQKDAYHKRASALFDELVRETSGILEHIDLLKFEHYRQLIGEFLREVLQNTYFMQSERVMGPFGKQHVYETVGVIDRKLEALGQELLRQSSQPLNYLSRVDEIRGLVLDLFL